MRSHSGCIPGWLGSRQLRDRLAINHSKMLAYAGILANPGRSPEIVCALVAHCFDLSDVTLQNWQRRMVEIEPDQYNSLGCHTLKNGAEIAGRSVLGQFVLGTRVPDLCGKFQLSISNLSRKQFLSFLPSGENFLPLAMFVAFVLRDQLAWDLCLGLAPEQVSAMRLGDNKSALLGWTSFLGDPESVLQSLSGSGSKNNHHGAEYGGRKRAAADAFTACC